ncbi:UNKNOWN [Stylonychia lemnae]|uniref:Uncharacterized protein n=1 Tax=Stylonychia lemnae TaxID=5949 RepID=A0A078AGK1_STYLE|nr:UNKNOWN [Stylonychia lemnae]|eukprot:CDW80951.1 UNKNOWN [Stylonychia lemnae]
MQTKLFSLLLISMVLTGNVASFQLQAPKVEEYTLFGEFDPLIQFVKFNAGLSLGIYKGLLWQNVPQYRADGCYRELWDLADKIITSFSLIGRGPEHQYIAFGIFSVDLSQRLYSAANVCIPLFFENPATFKAEVDPINKIDLYTKYILKILGNIYIMLYNTEEYVLGRGLADLYFDVSHMIKPSIA